MGVMYGRDAEFASKLDVKHEDPAFKQMDDETGAKLMKISVQGMSLL
jgi:hypothetical protein